MGKKKGAKTAKTQNENWGDDESAATSLLDAAKAEIGEDATPLVGQRTGGKKSGKKNRKKDFADEDIEAELLALAVEQNLEPTTTTTTQTQSKAVETKSPEEVSKEEPSLDKPIVDKKQDDPPPMLETKEPEPPTEGATTAVGSSKKTKKGKKGKKQAQESKEDDIDALLKEIEGEPQQQNDASSKPVKQDSVEETPEGASSVVKSKADKKKEKKKRQQQQKQEEEGDKDQEEKEEAQPDILQDNAAAEDDEDGCQEDKKKKKKKKKKGEEEKAASKPDKKLKGILKMKKEIEAIRAAQKKREEEELARQKAEEEEERKRLEALRIEEERKERKKQKEKEKRERLRQEGKLLTKAQKQQQLRREAQLQALEAQGIVVPRKKETEGDGEKKRFRYVTSSRKKPKKLEKEACPGDDNATEDSGVHEEGSMCVSEDLEGKDNWDDESEEEDGVKEAWDEDVDEIEEQPAATVLPVAEEITAPAPQDSVAQKAEVKPVEESEEEESSSESDDSSESDEDDDESISAYDRAANRIRERSNRYKQECSPDMLRSPVVCVLGHVDTGKTKILDKIRHTSVQDGEAGGITQQIGATFVPETAIREQTKMLKEFQKQEIKLPGLLIIDTPGHEAFSNLRTRGSSMCDLAILVVDIMHGLEPQTIESLNLLRKGNVPFLVALNKIDRMYDWQRRPTSGVRETLKKQKVNTKEEFDERVKDTVTQFAEQGVNAALFWDKVDFTEYIPLVPTSAITGDGIGDIMAFMVTYCQNMMTEKLMFCKDLEAIVLEVKVIAGLGTTIDIILRNGILNEGDTLVLMGSEGPFVANIRALLMPQPLKELRVKNAYVNHKVVIASQGVKVCAKDLEKTLPGTPVFVAKKPDEVEVLKDTAAKTLSSALGSIKLKERGVFVQASTLGSLEALLGFLKSSKIPYAGVNIGPVHKKDVMKASVMLERDNQWAVILAFDVKVEREAQEMADAQGVKIFTADIIYHLFDSFMKYREELKERRRKEHEHLAIFPCKLRVLPNCIYNSRNPIVMGVVVEAGIIKPGTPLTVPSKNFCDLGQVTSIEANHKSVDIARKGTEVCIKIDSTSGDAPKMYGRHFSHEDMLVSKINRESINAVKNFFREDLQKADWQLMIELKRTFEIL